MKPISLVSDLMIFSLFILSFQFSLTTTRAAGGKWQLLQQNVGISAMHMQLLYNDRVIMFDRTDFGKSNLSLPNGTCVRNDCTAHSAEYDVTTNTVRPLTVQSDIWCSSGSVAPNGNLIQTGGYDIGERRVRVFEPCTGCDWKEYENTLGVNRWYATDHILPDGRQIIIGGRRQFNYEFYPKTESSNHVYSFPFLVQTNDPNEENNLYPYVFLNVDGNLFIFANNRAILFDYVMNKVVKTYPQIPGGDPRSYPSTGSAVLLPLRNLTTPSIEAEVLVCGGAPKGSYIKAIKGTFVEALNTCGRIKINDPKPQWVVETMPQARVMSDMLLLPDGTVLIINGASFGTAGWELGQNPVLEPLVYRPDNAVGSRFEKPNPASIPRMYHSTAVLLRDGRVLVGGSNPHDKYELADELFPTELRLEAFSPDYLDAKYSKLRPRIVDPKSQAKISYGKKLFIRFSLKGSMATNLVMVTIVAPSFNTHSFSMNQRLLVLAAETVKKVGTMTYQVQVTTPGSGNLAPSGYYLLYVVHQQIPSEGIWVQILL
ncbi:aldehyde oxidase GLOX1-like [Pyrus x bretschneideri]|uniref:aldehyde oxidase GLOX1-like n=1 Tax=Pyrus x bretschneideri TaxID=225117 RepID=UPI00202ED960|nr:aldehyde oxidase GLOX1-like [Pyrus x bretschneideri]